MKYPALFAVRAPVAGFSPPATIRPVEISTSNISPAASMPKWRPSGFIHIHPVHSGSRTEIWPDWPSVHPVRAQVRKTAAMWVRMCSRSVEKDGKVGIPDNGDVSQSMSGSERVGKG